MTNKRIYDLTEDTTPSAGDYLVIDKSGLTEATKVDVNKFVVAIGLSGGQTLYGDTAANGDITIHGTSNSTRTTSYVLLQPTAGNVGIRTTAPGAALDVAGNIQLSGTTPSIINSTTRLDLFTAAGGSIYFAPNNTYGGRWSSVGLAIGHTSPDSLFHVSLADAGTNTAAQVVTISHNGGTAAAGFGSRILWELESSTTDDQTAAIMDVVWAEATHATRKARAVLSVYDTAVRECVRLEASGTAAMIGFLGANASARLAHVADPAGGGTVDAEARSAINSILTTLETFGFHSTS